MVISKNSGTPKSSILIGFSIVFTIHFGVFPYFWRDPYDFRTSFLIYFEAFQPVESEWRYMICDNDLSAFLVISSLCLSHSQYVW